MGGGAWPFLVGGVICLVNSDNERDLNLLNSYRDGFAWAKRWGREGWGRSGNRLVPAFRSAWIPNASRCGGGARGASRAVDPPCVARDRNFLEGLFGLYQTEV
jgi:hypothetical protein